MPSIRCISLWQPWASLVALGIKTTETRGKPAPSTILGTRIGIHAARSLKGYKPPFMTPELLAACSANGLALHPGPPFGCIVATAVVEASIPAEKLTPDIFGNYAPGRFGWMLCDIRPLAEPIPWKGAQGIFFADIEEP